MCTALIWMLGNFRSVFPDKRSASCFIIKVTCCRLGLWCIFKHSDSLLGLSISLWLLTLYHTVEYLVGQSIRWVQEATCIFTQRPLLYSDLFGRSVTLQLGSAWRYFSVFWSIYKNKYCGHFFNAIPSHMRFKGSKSQCKLITDTINHVWEHLAHSIPWGYP